MRLLWVVGVAAAVLACSEPRPPVQIEHPTLEGWEPAVRARLETVRRDLEMAQGSASGSELAAAYGEMGRHYQSVGLDESARQCYSNAAALDPKKADWPYLAAVVELTLGHSGTAIRLLREALDLDPLLAVARVRLGEALLEEGDVEGARSAFLLALESEPVSAWAHQGLGRADLMLGELEESARQFEAALALAPEATSLHHSLAQAYARLGRVDLAAQHRDAAGVIPVPKPDTLLAAVGGLADSTGALLGRGSRFAKSGQGGAAIDLYLKAVAEDPANLGARLSLAAALSAAGQKDQAEEHFGAALALAPEDPNVHHQLGTHRSRGGDNAQAVADFEEALRLDPVNQNAAVGRALALEKLGRLKEALDAWATVEALDPQSRRARVARGRILLSLGRLEEAEAILRGLLQIDSEDLEAAANLAVVLTRTDRSQAAYDLLKEAADFEGEPAVRSVVLFNLGVLDARRGDPMAASRAYGRALEFDPNHVGARVNRANLLVSSDPGRAAAEYGEAARRGGPWVPLKVLEVQTLVGAGALEQAAAAITVGLERAPTSPDLLKLDAELRKRSSDPSPTDAGQER